MNNKTAKELLAARLIELREQNNLTQQDLADKLHITRQSLSLYERAERTINIDLLLEISRFFNVSSDYLLGISEIVSPDDDIHTAVNNLGLTQKSAENIKAIAQSGWSANILLESEWLGAFVRILTNIDEWSSKLNYYNQVIVPAINENISLDDENNVQVENLVCIRNVLYSEFRYIVNSQVDSDDTIEHLDYEYIDKIDINEFKLSKVLKSMVDEVKTEHKADKVIFELSNKTVYDGLNERKKDIENLVQEYEAGINTGSKSAKAISKAVETYNLQLNAINTILENFDDFFKPKKGTDENG